MKVISDKYTKAFSLKETTPYIGNSKGIRSNIVDNLTCIRLLYLAQNVIDMRTAENLVSDRDTQRCQDKLRLPCVYMCAYTQRS